jgi:hypothetical protein
MQLNVNVQYFNPFSLKEKRTNFKRLYDYSTISTLPYYNARYYNIEIPR